jgi:long-subunit acyl-CoA synthetase (AMP-forming)
VIGDHEHFPYRDNARHMPGRSSRTYFAVEEMASHPWVVSQIKEALRTMNQTLAPHEAVTRFSILTHEFSVTDGELTPTLKLKRAAIMQRYSELIEQMDRGGREEGMFPTAAKTRVGAVASVQ